MKKVADVFLEEQKPFEVNQNELYFFDGDWLHTTDYADNPITLLFEDRRALRPWADAFVRKGKEYKNVVKYDSPALSLEEYRDAIESALKTWPHFFC